MAEDCVVVGLTEDNDNFAKAVINTGKIGDKIDFARFSFAYAIMNHLEDEAKKFNSTTATTWNIGSLDTDNVMQTVVTCLFPEVTHPRKFINSLINVGMEHIKTRFVANGNKLDLNTLMQPL